MSYEYFENNFYPFPSPRSPSRRPEHSKYENTPWFPKWIPRGIALQIDFQGNTALKAAFLGFEAHKVAFNGVSNGGTGEAGGVFGVNYRKDFLNL